MKIEIVRLNDETLSELRTLQLSGEDLPEDLLSDLSYQLNNKDEN
jgi:hypothetical protein